MILALLMAALITVSELASALRLNSILHQN
jgi:hypothetical protein